jgi:hypothetical protein
LAVLETLLQITLNQTDPIAGGAQREPLAIALFCHGANLNSSRQHGIEYIRERIP